MIDRFACSQGTEEGKNKEKKNTFSLRSTKGANILLKWLKVKRPSLPSCIICDCDEFCSRLNASIKIAQSFFLKIFGIKNVNRANSSVTLFCTGVPDRNNFLRGAIFCKCLYLFHGQNTYASGHKKSFEKVKWMELEKWTSA